MLIAAQVVVLSAWFSATAVIAELARESGLAATELARLATATQAGFVIGALALAISGVPDRFDPRRVFACCSVFAGAANLALLVLPADSTLAVISRAIVGAMLAGVYPVGLKIAVGWSERHRGLLASLLVGALTLGSAMPHLVAFLGGSDWRLVLGVTSALTVVGAIMVFGVGLGPYHARSAKFSPGALTLAARLPRVRAAYLGYFGHMWELYAFWAWASAALLASGAAANAKSAAGWTFVAMVLGAVACIPGGRLADRLGKARVARGLLLGSAISGAVAALAVANSPTLFLIAVLCWGLFVLPDSPLFSALVADAAPPDNVGSLLTLQTAIGFGLTIVSVRLLPAVAESWSWTAALAMLVVGPVCGVVAMRAEARSN